MPSNCLQNFSCSKIEWPKIFSSFFLLFIFNWKWAKNCVFHFWIRKRTMNQSIKSNRLHWISKLHSISNRRVIQSFVIAWRLNNLWIFSLRFCHSRDWLKLSKTDFSLFMRHEFAENAVSLWFISNWKW